MPRAKEQMDFRLPPILKKLKRGPQVLLPKDLGMIVAYGGMSKESVVVDAGAGSGTHQARVWGCARRTS